MCWIKVVFEQVDLGDIELIKKHIGCGKVVRATEFGSYAT